MGKGRVCVTGGTGFLGSWMVKTLLEDGYSVNTTIRLSQGSKRDISYLTNLSERLRIFEADLDRPESFKAAMEGCDGVFHTAHPMDSGDHEAEQVKIARSRNALLVILQACLDSKTVKRVVYTSSIAAAAFHEAAAAQLTDESHWTNVELVRSWGVIERSYIVEKTVAERAALDFAEESGLDVITVLPSWIHGPFITPACPHSVHLSMALIFVTFGDISKLIKKPPAQREMKVVEPRRDAEKRRADDRADIEVSKKRKGTDSRVSVPLPATSKSKGKEVVFAKTTSRAPRTDLTAEEITGFINSLTQRCDESESRAAALEAEKAALEAEKAELRKECARKDELLRDSLEKMKDLRNHRDVLSTQLVDAETALRVGATEQGEVLRAYTKRLLLSNKFALLANDLAGILNEKVAWAVLTEAAKSCPGLEVSQFGFKDVGGKELLRQYVSVVKGYLDDLPLLNQLASSASLLSAREVEQCDVDRHDELHSFFASEKEILTRDDDEVDRVSDVVRAPAAPTETAHVPVPPSKDDPKGKSSGAVAISELEFAEMSRLKARVMELEEKLAEANRANDSIKGKMLEDHRRIQSREDRIQSLKLKVDELCARLVQTQEERDAAKGRADRILEDHEKIVEEHGEYEDVIRRNGGSTISEVETRINELTELYVKLKHAGGPNSSEAEDALKKIQKAASYYGLILQRRPKLREE